MRSRVLGGMSPEMADNCFTVAIDQQCLTRGTVISNIRFSLGKYYHPLGGHDIVDLMSVMKIHTA
jgi:hypothetical protein